jgi:hypothetical protein
MTHEWRLLDFCPVIQSLMALKKRTFVVLLLPVLIAFAMMMFLRSLPPTCPSPDMLQSDFVKTSFKASKMEGLWYELAMKDITQPRICSCQTSNKTLHQKTLHDEFRIECFGNSYTSNISFALQDMPGVIMATWHGIPLLDRIVFPNTIVDVQVGTDGNYEWMLEFQCVQGPSIFGWNWIAFYAFNFYSRTLDDGQRLHIMEARARQRGIGPFIDHWAKLAIIDHSNCLYAR